MLLISDATTTPRLFIRPYTLYTCPVTSWRFSIAIHKRSKNQVNTASYKHSLDPSKQDSHQESICTPTPFLTGYVMDASAPHDSLHHSAKKSPIKIYGKVARSIKLSASAVVRLSYLCSSRNSPHHHCRQISQVSAE